MKTRNMKASIAGAIIEYRDRYYERDEQPELVVDELADEIHSAIDRDRMHSHGWIAWDWKEIKRNGELRHRVREWTHSTDWVDGSNYFTFLQYETPDNKTFCQYCNEEEGRFGEEEAYWPKFVIRIPDVQTMQEAVADFQENGLEDVADISDKFVTGADGGIAPLDKDFVDGQAPGIPYKDCIIGIVNGQHAAVRPTEIRLS